MCNILIYFCNIDIKYLQYIFETLKIFKIDACNIEFQRKHLITARKKGSSLARGVLNMTCDRN
jgi:hypothetical protein